MWFGTPDAMTAWPDPDPGLPLDPVRRTVEYTLANGGRVVDFIGRARRDHRLVWTGLDPAETALIEQYADGSRGGGPFFVLLDGGQGWNFLHPLLASVSCLTGDASGWAYDPSTTLVSVTDPVLRGPRALQWTVPASGSDRWMWPQLPDVPQMVPLGLLGTPWTWTFNARTLAGTVTMFAQLYGTEDSADGPDTPVGTDWTPVSVTYTPALGSSVMPFIAKRPGPDPAGIIIDTPRITAGPTVQPWTPGRGVPQVAVVEASITARWHDLYDVALTLREVGR